MDGSARSTATTNAVAAITTLAEPRVAAAQETGAHGDRHRAEERAREQAEQDGVQQLGSDDGGTRRSRPRSSRARRRTVSGRAVAGGSAVGFAAGWNIADTGAVADELAAAYGVALARDRALHRRALPRATC